MYRSVSAEDIIFSGFVIWQLKLAEHTGGAFVVCGLLIWSRAVWILLNGSRWVENLKMVVSPPCK